MASASATDPRSGLLFFSWLSRLAGGSAAWEGARKGTEERRVRLGKGKVLWERKGGEDGECMDVGSAIERRKGENGEEKQCRAEMGEGRKTENGNSGNLRKGVKNINQSGWGGEK